MAGITKKTYEDRLITSKSLVRELEEKLCENKTGIITDLIYDGVAEIDSCYGYLTIRTTWKGGD